jgi:protein deglycase
MTRVLVPMAHGCEELEAITLIDLMRRAGIEVVTAGLVPGMVHCSHGTRLMPDCNLDEVTEEDFDLMVLPGGLPGSNHLDADPRIRRLLVRLAAEDRFVAAICAAPKVLASAGLLRGKSTTAYPGSFPTDDFPEVRLLTAPVVVDGKTITSRGPGTAMDFALQLIESLEGKARREEVETALVRGL